MNKQYVVKQVDRILFKIRNLFRNDGFNVD